MDLVENMDFPRIKQKNKIKKKRKSLKINTFDQQRLFNDSVVVQCETKEC